MSTAEKYDAAGGPAFPVADPCEHGGMTLRDYFAGQAIASIPNRVWDDVGNADAMIKAWARCAYAVADAMLVERSPSPGRGGDAT
jgi:hypothetical protein